MKIIKLNLKRPSLANKIESVGDVSFKMFPHWTRILIWSLQLEKKPYMVFYSRVASLWKANGLTFTVLYLKEATRLVHAYISGNPVILSDDRIILGIVGGLPKIIPGRLRLLIREGDAGTIRGVLTLLSVYRVMKIPAKMKLETITDPFKGISETLPTYELIKATREITSKILVDKLTLDLSVLQLGTAGPNAATSALGIWNDIKKWSTDPLLPDLKEFMSFFKGGKDLYDVLYLEMHNLSFYKEARELYLGRLSVKVEAAGKARVFAITDVITQTVMKPLHDKLFSIIDSIVTDGTFDQDRPIRHLRELYRLNKSNPERQTFYSYDLSAATDRLPIALQTQILSYLIGDRAAELWRNLLTKRDWILDNTKKPYQHNTDHEFYCLRYSVGQPMGALSSWAMLALTHHVIVRLAANRVGIHSFTDYGLLGDDIVIYNDAVAKSYHYIMTAVLGVEINLSKSMKSKDSFEFAKRIIRFDEEVSAIGAKNLLVALKTHKGIPSVLLDMVNKGSKLSETSVTKMFQEKIPTVRKSQFQKYLWVILGPFGFIPTADGLTADLKLSNSLSAVAMDSLLSSIDDALHGIAHRTWKTNTKQVINCILSYNDLKSPPGFKEYDIRLSPVYSLIMSKLGNKLGSLIAEEPTRRFIFDGPLVFTNYYREGWMKEMMEYIKSKIRLNEVTVSTLDPFAEDKINLPLSESFKGQNFFDAIQKIERDKSATRGYLSPWVGPKVVTR